MKTKRIFAASGAVSALLAACVFQACGGSEEVKKDGGGGNNDSSMDMPDVNNMMPDSNMDMDTSMMDTGPVDSGPNCTNMPCVVGLGVGGHHACAIINDGTVRCWGRNQYGQLGSGGNDAGMLLDAATRAVPVPVDGITNATQVAASVSYTTFGSTCVRQSSGAVQCFGNNGVAQLGMRADAGAFDNNPHPWPTPVANLPMSNSVGLGNYTACATTSANEFWCWGDNGSVTGINGNLGRGPMPNQPQAPGKATLLSDAGAISSGSPGSFFTLAVANGTVYSWGYNQNGALGRMTNQGIDSNPAPVQNLSNVVQVSAGEEHACAVTQGGQVFCWGDNGAGQLGRGITGGSSNNPQAVTIPGNKQALQVSCSNAHTCVVTTDGSVYCWGANNAGQVGPNTPDGGGFNGGNVNTPAAVNLSAKALVVGTGGSNTGNFATGYSCAVLDGGSVVCWGYNGDANLGRGSAMVQNCGSQQFMIPCSPTPAPVVWQ